MDEQTANHLLDKLASGEVNEITVKKEDFLIFRNVLTKRDDFKHFRGIAKHGGDVIFEYLKEARS